MLGAPGRASEPPADARAFLPASLPASRSFPAAGGGAGRPPAVTQRAGPRGCARAPEGRGLACGAKGPGGGCAVSWSLFP